MATTPSTTAEQALPVVVAPPRQPSPQPTPNRSPAMRPHGSPNDFVFPRRPATTITGNGLATRPRSGTHDATMLLAEIGVLPPPMMATGSGRVRGTPYHPNTGSMQRPKSMLAMPTNSTPVTLAAASTGRTAHRRDTSEFLSPDAAAVAPKSETESAESKPKPSGPPAGFRGRGHAHRRSGAISSSDVWGLISQSSPSGLVVPPNSAPLAKVGGAQVSPDISANNSPVKSWSAPVTPGTAAAEQAVEMPTGRRASRVAFHDEVEIIPRPLSPTSTIASPHCGSNSISSIVDSNITSNNNTSKSRTTGGRNRSSSICSSTTPLSPELQGMFAYKMERPSTSGGLISTPAPKARTEALPTLRIDTDLSSSSNNNNNAKVGADKVKPAPSSPSAIPEKKSKKKTHKKALSDGSPQTPSPHSTVVEEESEKSKAKKEKRKKKHLKNFLFRTKGKKGSQKRSPTPPLPRTNSFRKDQIGHEAWAESYVLMQEPIMAGRSLEELSSTMSPRYNHSNASFTAPTIDLDAALMPFNSPAPQQKGSGGFKEAKKRMHSSGAGGKMMMGAGVGAMAFVGTHRRSESMPEMPSFMLGDARMEMDDVFEEDEEEEEDDSASSGSDSGSDSGESEDGVRRLSSEGGLRIAVQDVDGDGISRWQEVVNASAASPTTPHTGRRHSYAPGGTTASAGSPLRSSFRMDETSAPRHRATATSGFAAHRASKLLDQQQAPASPSSDACSTPTNLTTSTSFSSSSSNSTSTVTPAAPVVAAPATPTIAPITTTSSSTPTPSDCATPPASSSLFTSPSLTSDATSSSSLPSTPTHHPTSPSYPTTPTLKELAALSALEDPHFDPYLSGEFRFLVGEPGPELRCSVDDVPSLTSSASTMTSAYAAGAPVSLPATPRFEEMLAGGGARSRAGSVRDALEETGSLAAASTMSTTVSTTGTSTTAGKGKGGAKGALKKKLSRVFRFLGGEKAVKK